MTNNWTEQKREIICLLRIPIAINTPLHGSRFWPKLHPPGWDNFWQINAIIVWLVKEKHSVGGPEETNLGEQK